MKKQHCIIVISCLLLGYSLNAQELLRSSVGSTGSSQQFLQGDTELTIQQSVGQQSVIGTYFGNDLTLRQGFIQPPLEVKIGSSNLSDLDITVLPNPFDSQLNLYLNEQLKGQITIQIFDLLGRVVFQEVHEPARTITIELQQLATAEYILWVTAENRTFTANLLKN